MESVTIVFLKPLERLVFQMIWLGGDNNKRMVLLKLLNGRNGSRDWGGVPVEVVVIEFGNALNDYFEGNVPDFIEAVFGDVFDFVVGPVGGVVEFAEGGVEVEEHVVEIDADGEGVKGFHCYSIMHLINRHMDKKCAECGKYKKLESFPKSNSRSEGIGLFCYLCSKSRRKKVYYKNKLMENLKSKFYYAKNKEEIKKKKKIYYSLNKERILLKIRNKKR